MTTLIVVGGVVAVFLFVVLPSILIIVTEYERAVFFRLGHIREGAKGPGIVVRLPLIDRVVKVSLRVEVVDIPPQAAITSDNVTIQGVEGRGQLAVGIGRSATTGPGWAAPGSARCSASRRPALS